MFSSARFTRLYSSPFARPSTARVRRNEQCPISLALESDAALFTAVASYGPDCVVAASLALCASGWQRLVFTSGHVNFMVRRAPHGSRAWPL